MASNLDTPRPFIVAIRGTLTQAVLLGLAATMSHTAVVWAISLGGMYFGQRCGVKEHAYCKREKVHYLQNAVTNILNIEQNQIVKVFTFITSVFLPSTLMGDFLRYELLSYAGAFVGTWLHLFYGIDTRRRTAATGLHQPQWVAAQMPPPCRTGMPAGATWPSARSLYNQPDFLKR